MILNGYKFEFSPKFALSNFKRIRHVAALSRVTLASAIGLGFFVSMRQRKTIKKSRVFNAVRCLPDVHL